MPTSENELNSVVQNLNETAASLNEFKMTKEQIVNAINIYLNDHVFLEKVTVTDITTNHYGMYPLTIMMQRKI